MNYLRDAEYPLVLGMIEQRLAILKVMAETDPELESSACARSFSAMRTR